MKQMRLPPLRDHSICSEERVEATRPAPGMMLVHPWTDVPCMQTDEGFSHSPECSDAARDRAYAELRAQTVAYHRQHGVPLKEEDPEGWARGWAAVKAAKRAAIEVGGNDAR